MLMQLILINWNLRSATLKECLINLDLAVKTILQICWMTMMMTKTLMVTIKVHVSS